MGGEQHIISTAEATEAQLSPALLNSQTSAESQCDTHQEFDFVDRQNQIEVVVEQNTDCVTRNRSSTGSNFLEGAGAGTGGTWDDRSEYRETGGSGEAVCSLNAGSGEPQGRRAVVTTGSEDSDSVECVSENGKSQVCGEEIESRHSSLSSHPPGLSSNIDEGKSTNVDGKSPLPPPSQSPDPPGLPPPPLPADQSEQKDSEMPPTLNVASCLDDQFTPLFETRRSSCEQIAEEEEEANVATNLFLQSAVTASSSMTPKQNDYEQATRSQTLNDLSEFGKLSTSPRSARVTRRCKSQSFLVTGGELRFVPLPKPQCRSPAKRTSMSNRVPSYEAGETWKALKESVDRLDCQAVEHLLDAGVSANMPHDGSYNEPCYVTVLHSLCNRLVDPSGAPPPGSMAILEALLKAGANVNPRSSVGCTPLMRACARKNFEAARLLVEWQADVNVRDDAGFDALKLAIRLETFGSSSGFYDESYGKYGSLRAVDPQSKAQSREGKAEEMYTFRTPVPPPACTKARDVSVSGQLVKVLLDSMGDAPHSLSDSPNHSPRKGGTLTRGDDPLGFAMESGNSLSLASGSLSSSRTCHAPLLDAVMQQNHRAAAVILAKGARPHYLREAVESGCAEIVKVLLEYKADPMEEDITGETVMDVALQCVDDQVILDLLREAVRFRETIPEDVQPSDSKKLGRIRRASVFSTKSGARSRSASLSSGMLGILQAAKEPWWRRSCREWKIAVGDFYSDHLADSMDALSRNCRWISQQRSFQTAMCVCLFGALFLPDMWVLFDVTNDVLLDVLLLTILFGFLMEIVLNTLGWRMQYWSTFFFYMDLIGAVSLLFDLSFAREFSSSDGHTRTVVMRAARAAKLGARAGRFTKLVKLLRFLPGVGVNQVGAAHIGTAKGMARALSQQISVRVSCIIILMVVLFPVFNIFSYPDQDWSMALWTDRLSSAVTTGVQTDFDEVLEDARDFFDGMSYFPFQVRHGEKVLWQILSPLRESNRIKYTKDGVTVMFDFANPNRIEAATNFAMVGFTISLLMGFSLLLSHSVSTIGLIPLESLLSRVTMIGKTIYNRVDYIQKELKDWSSLPSERPSDRDDIDNISRMGCAGDAMSANDETRLLETVVQKIAALGEITMKKARPNDHETLMYLGENHYDYSASKTEAEEQQYNVSSSLMNDLAGDLLLLEDESGSLVGSWDFSPFLLDAAQSRGVCINILSRVAMKAVPDLPGKLIQTFVAAACVNHQQEPQYHNWYHAVDVMHTLVLVLHECSRQSVFLSRLEEYGLIVSAICHDLGHPGLNNDFLVQTQHELAMRYNDTSPLENMHCACLFEIARDPRSAIFGTLSKEKFKEVRALCIEAILHTDNTHHVSMVQKLQMFGEVNREMLDRAQRVFHQSSVSFASEDSLSKEIAWPTRELTDLLWVPDARHMLRPALLHFADIANPIKPFALCKEWAVRVLEEFFAQGDMEKEADLPVQPLNDRSKVNQPFSQVSFIEFFVAPLVFAMVRILSPIEDRIQVLLSNTNAWAQEWIDETNASTEEAQNILGRVRRLEERAPRKG